MVNNSLDDTFGSLADPTRRNMLKRLLAGEMTINNLAKAYNISLPAVSKHIKVLETAGLVVKERRGRQHFVRLKTENFQNAADHLLYYQTVLMKRLDSLDDYLKNGATVAPAHTHAANPPMQTITITHTFDAPLQEVWNTYTNPKDISKWWGPKNATLVSCYNDVRVQGIWRFAFQGTEGQDYVVSGKYQEVEPQKRLVYTDGFGEADSERPEAMVTITFEALENDKTRLTKTSVAPRTTHQLQAAWLKSAEG